MSCRELFNFNVVNFNEIKNEVGYEVGERKWRRRRRKKEKEEEEEEEREEEKRR